MHTGENNPLFDMSPPVFRGVNTAMSEGSSVSLSNSGLTQKAPVSMSIPDRAPFGELQHNTFEFKPMQSKGAADVKGKANPLPSFGGLRQPADSITASTRDPHTPEPATPCSASAQSRDLSATAANSTAPKKRINWTNIILWKEPLQSLFIFTVGLLAFGLLTFAAYGAHSMTVVSAISYLLLLDLGLNFFRYFVSKPWHDKCLWGGAAQMKQFLTKVNSVFLHLAAAHDQYLSAVDPFVTLRVASVLWAMAWIGRFISLWWCVLLAYVGIFTVPAVYVACKGHVHAMFNAVWGPTGGKITQLPRITRFFATAGIVTALYFIPTVTFTQFTISCFVAATYWRTMLVPREIDNIRTFAEPYTQSVQKVSRRLTVAAEDAFVRMSTGPASRTKSHFRQD
eukprot:gene10174-10334_t